MHSATWPTLERLLDCLVLATCMAVDALNAAAEAYFNKIVSHSLLLCLYYKHREQAMQLG